MRDTVCNRHTRTPVIVRRAGRNVGENCCESASWVTFFGSAVRGTVYGRKEPLVWGLRRRLMPGRGGKLFGERLVGRQGQRRGDTRVTATGAAAGRWASDGGRDCARELAGTTLAGAIARGRLRAAPSRRLWRYSARRASMARPKVSSSAYSRSPPTGRPLARRVTVTPSGLMVRAR